VTGVFWVVFYLIGQFKKKTAGALTGVRGGCINVKFYSEISCSDFDSCGEFLENKYAKKTQSR